MATMNLLAGKIHDVNVKNGFYEEEKNIGEMLALIHSEVSEGLEALRKGNEYKNPQALRGILDHQKDDLFKVAFERNVKDSFEDELADAIIRILDLCAYKDIDIDAHVKAKLRYNSLRPYKHGKKF